MIKVIEAATLKFGKVIGIVERKLGPGYYVACIRDTPPIPSLPAMTITAFVNNEDKVEFHWGHYDLQIEETLNSMGEY